MRWLRKSTPPCPARANGGISRQYSATMRSSYPRPDACALTTTPNPNLDPNPDPPQSSSSAPTPASRPRTPTPAPGWRANIATALLARLRDVLELVLLPAVCAAVISAITWLIWYYMAVPCTPDFTDTTYCYPTPNARYPNM